MVYQNGLNKYYILEMYNKRTWLNKEDSPSTGNVVAYDGYYEHDGKKYRNLFLSVSDCYNAARLHKTEDDTVDDFILKMKTLRDNIDEFIEYLEKNK